LKVLHTEASPGFGGQEIRILREAIGMRKRGVELVFAVQKGGGLVAPLRKVGFRVYELSFSRNRVVCCFLRLCWIMQKERVTHVNTHSSWDAWPAGFAAKFLRRKLVRTRHLSTAIRPGANSRILYNFLADHVVTTCQEVVEPICRQANLPLSRITSVPTGVDPEEIGDVALGWRKKMGFLPTDIVVGTCCVFRGWKGVTDLLQAAKLLEDLPNVKFLLVGGGVSEGHFLAEYKRLGLEKKVFFTGYLEKPYEAVAAMDIFALLSWANEGVSQASLQAAYLQKPLITTPTGGLKEVCLEGKTGHLVAARAPNEVADAIRKLAADEKGRKQMGLSARAHVEKNFLFEKTLDEMQRIYVSTGRI